MNLTIYQKIIIQNLRFGNITNSAVVQIGSAGEIRAQANLYNTGGFTGLVPGTSGEVVPLVPLAPST